MTVSNGDAHHVDPRTALELRAGPAHLTVVEGCARWVRLAGVEVVRAIYGAVRDPEWGTILPTFSSYDAAVGVDSFEVRFRAECTRAAGGIDFAWTGTITGTREGTIRFVFDGVARSTVLVARIGLCVLHPSRLAGDLVDVETTFGRLRGRFPDLITGYLPFSNVTRIRHDLGRRQETQIDFVGDAFQTQDQRAFTDASFKTFSRSLELPWPYKVTAGTAIRQIVTVSFPRRAGIGPRPRPRLSRHPLAIELGPATYPFPLIGAGAPPIDVARTRPVVAAIRNLGLAHLRCTVDARDEDPLVAVARAAADAHAAAARLELVLVAGPEREDIEAIAKRLASLEVDVARCLPIDPESHCTTPALAQCVRDALAAAGVRGALVGGTRGYLYQLVSHGVPESLVDIVSYPANPQVHAFDDESIVETIDVLPTTVRTASALVRGKPVAVGPVSLRALFNPDARAPEAVPFPGELPSRYDRRQLAPLAAGDVPWSGGLLSDPS